MGWGDTEIIFKEPPTDIELTNIYNFYAEKYSWADSKKFLAEYIAKHEPSLSAYFKKLHEYEISWVCGWIARMISKGSVLDKKTLDYLNKYLVSLKEKVGNE